MDLRLPLPRLVCRDCSAKHSSTERGLRPDYMNAEVELGEESGRPARTVPFKIKRLRFEDLEDGSAKAHILVRVPCVDGDHMHEIDIGDLFQAPQLYLSGLRRCANNHPMSFERQGAWEYVDDEEYGGTIEFSGVLRCAQCNTGTESVLRSAGSLSLDGQQVQRVEVDMGAAQPLGGDARAR